MERLVFVLLVGSFMMASGFGLPLLEHGGNEITLKEDDTTFDLDYYRAAPFCLFELPVRFGWVINWYVAMWFTRYVISFYPLTLIYLAIFYASRNSPSAQDIVTFPFRIIYNIAGIIFANPIYLTLTCVYVAIICPERTDFYCVDFESDLFENYINHLDVDPGFDIISDDGLIG